MTKLKWTDDVYISYLNLMFKENNFPSYLNEKTPLIMRICQELNVIYPEKGITVDGLLSHIARNYKNLKFVSPMFGGKGGVAKFYASKKKNIQIETNDVKLGLIEAVINIQDERDSLGLERIDVNFNCTFSLNENIKRITEKNKISELEAYAELYRKDLIKIYKNNITKKVTTMENENILTENKKEEFLKEEIGKVFKHRDTDYNLFLFNDGTGSGKTHNVVMNYGKSFSNPTPEKEKILEFIGDYSNNKNIFEIKHRHSLVFIAPQKNQLFNDVDVFNAAKNSKIPLLFARSRVDTLNLSGKNFFKLATEEEYETVTDFFNEVLRADKNYAPKLQKTKIDKKIKDLFKKRMALIDDVPYSEDEPQESERVPSLSVLYGAYKAYRDFEENHKYEMENQKEWYELNYELVKDAFNASLYGLAQFMAVNIDDKVLNEIFNSGSFYDGFDNFNEIFGDDAEFYELAYKLISYVLPFEVAKYINVIVYMTGDKSQTYMPISEPHKKIPNLKVCRNYDLDEIVSGYKISRKADVLSVYKDNSNFASFLNNEYFQYNYCNYFYNNGLGFSIVCDEEHILYNKFIEEYTFKNITERKNNVQVNIAHSLAAIARWIENIRVEKRNIKNFTKIYAEKTSIISSLYKELKKHTSLTTDKDIDDFFKSVLSNENGIFVKTSDYEFITTVCDNITSFSPKLIMLQDYLKTIKIITYPGSDYILVSKDNKEYSPDLLKYNMLDLFQVVLTLLLVCKNTSFDLRNLLYTEKERNNQNNALYHLLNLAHDNRDFLDNLFSSSLNLKEDDPVNFQFAYFLTKIGFSFDFPKKIKSKQYDVDSVPVEPNIFIVKELPEVGVLHMLKNPKNKVFLLSATRGFNNIFAGNYSEYFFDEINKYCPSLIKIFKRENQPNNPMPAFIENRFDKRISIEVVKLNITNNKSKRGNSVDVVDAFIYPINNIDLNSLNKTGDLTPVRETYDLINQVSGQVNFLEDLVYKAKNSDKFSRYINPYNRAEVLGILNSMVHSFEKNEHSIVMTLSNKFKEFLEDDGFMESVFGKVNFVRGDANKYKIFEYKPIPGSNKKLRVIFFDAELGKISNLNEHLIIDPETTIVLVSSYNSAGTGLNLTLSQGDEGAIKLLKTTRRDFNSIYFVSSPFYTSVKDDNGYSHLSNQLIIYKNFAHTGSKTIKDLSDGLASKNIKQILYKEHLMEKVKALMQSAGRIERRDASIKTRIYFVENGLTPIFEQAMSEFYEMFKLHSNQHSKTIVANFSMLNKSILKTSLNHITMNCLNLPQRNALEKETNLHYEVMADFFSNSNKFPMFLNQYRLNNPLFYWVPEFNGIFRNYISPDYNLKKMLVDFIKKNFNALTSAGVISYLTDLLPVLEFDFNAHNIPTNKPITINWNKSCYSDYSNSISFVNDKYFYDYARDLMLNEIGYEEYFLKDIFQKYRYPSILTKLPNLYLSHIIRGNVGERVLVDYFNEQKIPFNNMAQHFNKGLEQFLYELFDFYVISGNQFYAIDTKNWTQYSDAGVKKSLMALPDKIKKIKSRVELAGYEMNFIYLNMFPECNTDFTQGLSTHLGSFKEVKYMNFVVKSPVYKQEVYKNPKKQALKNKINPNSDYDFKDENYVINEEWKNLYEK